jgi:hypothetical protein
MLTCESAPRPFRARTGKSVNHLRTSLSKCGTSGAYFGALDWATSLQIRIHYRPSEESTATLVFAFSNAFEG